MHNLWFEIIQLTHFSQYIQWTRIVLDALPFHYLNGKEGMIDPQNSTMPIPACLKFSRIQSKVWDTYYYVTQTIYYFTEMSKHPTSIFNPCICSENGQIFVTVPRPWPQHGYIIYTPVHPSGCTPAQGPPPGGWMPGGTKAQGVQVSMVYKLKQDFFHWSFTLFINVLLLLPLLGLIKSAARNYTHSKKYLMV